MSAVHGAVVAISDHDLLAMMQAIGDQSGERAQSLDSRTVSRRLGWSHALTSASLGAAKARLLVWGIRVGGTPTPGFEDIELTVQGRRFLRAAATTTRYALVDTADAGPPDED